jgi:hypothetical protein
LKIVYGVNCVWWDTIDKCVTRENNLPCCPHCKSVLFEASSEEEWYKKIDNWEETHPGYKKFMDWLKGKCFKTRGIAEEQYKNKVECIDLNNYKTTYCAN